jgi:molybdate transport system substrate-binding protein
MRIASFAAASRFAFIIVFLQGAAASAAEVKVWAGGAFGVAMKELGARFERATGHKLAAEFAASPVFLKRTQAGEIFDVAILVPATIDAWIKEGKVIADTRLNVARATLGIGARAGAPKPDVGSADALKRTLLAAATVSYFPGGTIGKHFLSVLDRLGIAADMKTKLKPAKAGGASPAAVAKGEAELAVAFIPAIVSTPGVALAGPFPGELAHHVDLVAGVSTKAKEPEAAKAFVKLLASPEGVATIKAKGFDRMP